MGAAIRDLAGGLNGLPQALEHALEVRLWRRQGHMLHSPDWL